MSRHELMHEPWAVIQPLLSLREPKRGRPRADDRKTLNEILYVLKTGSAGQDLPREYGAPTPWWRRLQEWVERLLPIWAAVMSQTFDAAWRAIYKSPNN